ncbi:hypothetical protein [Flavobacterium psychrotrophum]|uniref:hypothetical protein n=1 Tax=Flavobacterium psychrotrophum TaxID=2294119 RepID=UPI000E3179D7|nr:hypothetical protein [Flavobacterium psychrotrophum]
MTGKINILYIGRHPEITETVNRLLNNNDEWHGLCTTLDHEAQALFKAHNITIVLLGNGISKEEESELRSFFAEYNPAAKIVQHYGGGSGLLKSEIYMALNSNT